MSPHAGRRTLDADEAHAHGPAHESGVRAIRRPLDTAFRPRARRPCLRPAHDRQALDSQGMGLRRRYRPPALWHAAHPVPPLAAGGVGTCPGGGVFTFNDAFYDLIGTTAEREEGYTVPIEQYFRKFVHPDDLSMVHRFVEGIRSSDSHQFDDLDARIIRADGEVRHILTGLRVFRGETGQSVKIFGINQDITDRKKTEEALKESESRFRGAFEASGIGMVLVALDHRWLKVNQSFCDMVGYSEEELLAKTFEDITHPDDLKEDLEYVQRLIDDQIPYYRLEKRYYHRDGI